MREIEETRALYLRLRDRQRTLQATAESVGEEVKELLGPVPLQERFDEALQTVIRAEQFIFDFPDMDLGNLSLQEFVELRDLLRHKEYFFANQARVLRALHEGLVRVFGEIADIIPKMEAPSPFTIPLLNAMPEPGLFMSRLLKFTAEDEYMRLGLFRDLRRTLHVNLYEASGVPLGAEEGKFMMPHESKLPLAELSVAYLSGTPFGKLLETPVPLKLTHADRFNHMHIVGGTGAGKTTLLENLILHDLTSSQPPALVVIDSQGDLIRKIAHLAMFDPDGGRLRDRLVLISPKDIDHPPAVNIFDLKRARLAGYDEATREQVTAGVIQTFDYLFSGLLGADLTAKQGVFFRFVARLMLSLPDTLGRNATILDMLRLMTDDAPYREAIQRLPEIPREFFQRDFSSKTFAQTKEQIRYRLNAILENPTLARLFTATETRVDLFEEMNKGSIILVDTAKDFLKSASPHFGRIFISLVLQAVLERAALAERDRPPAFLIIDEAASYFDGNIDDLLTDARKYRCGCVFAHQYLDQCPSSLRASFAANTSIKFASGVSNSDARALATDMRTAADFILEQPRLQFAAHIRNVTPQAVTIPVRTGMLEREPQLTKDRHERLLAHNRLRVSGGRKAAIQETSAPAEIVQTKEAPDPTAASPDW